MHLVIGSRPFVVPSPCVLQEGPCPSVCLLEPVCVLLSGIPCPIIVAWAIGKLYYENEQ